MRTKTCIQHTILGIVLMSLHGARNVVVNCDLAYGLTECTALVFQPQMLSLSFCEASLPSPGSATWA